MQKEKSKQNEKTTVIKDNESVITEVSELKSQCAEVVLNLQLLKKQTKIGYKVLEMDVMEEDV